MARLASPIETLKEHYAVVVIGSGYGAAIAASRLARAGKQVCVLERGREFQPGEYPNRTPQALAEMQSHTPECPQIGSRTGLYRFSHPPGHQRFCRLRPGRHFAGECQCGPAGGAARLR